MTSLLANKDRYIENFADSVYVEYRRLNYGIKSCRPTRKLYLDEMRKGIIDYYDLGNGFTCPTGCNCTSCIGLRGSCQTVLDSCYTACETNNTVVNNLFGTSFVWNQTVASTMWTIRHNLGYVPNVFAEDATGSDIVGVVTVISADTIKITFNTPVAGIAYLS
jgi:hypothetical protein